ncbi:MAG: metallophosphoesterase, partial [Proteobacteria bacterium]|nr:metallophosphoesterase [Pseudomonadota bacterium]
ILAVLGNHDIVAESSAALQRDAIPEFVSNWRLLDGCAGSVELGHGVSLVMADSTNECRPHGWEALADALRAARGPWRILAAHHPVNVADGGAPSPGGGFTKIVNRAIDESGVEVQLALSGHQHNLQILEQPSRGVALAVIAGSGAKSKAIRNPHPARRFAADELGFARVDLVDGDAGPRLVVSLFATPRLALLPSVLGAGPELRARWSVSLAGEVRDEG